MKCLSFVANKENKQWIWLAMDVVTRQIIAFHVGGRGQEDAEKLWQQIPALYREQAHFFTDYWSAYVSELLNVSVGTTEMSAVLRHDRQAPRVSAHTNRFRHSLRV